MRRPIVLDIYEALAEEMNFSYHCVDPKGWLGRIDFHDGISFPFIKHTLPLNKQLNGSIAKDKWHTHLMLEGVGLGVPKTNVFYQEAMSEYCEASETQAAMHKAVEAYFATENAAAFVIKPNKLDKGRGVHIVRDAEQGHEAIEKVFSMDYVALWQEYVAGTEYRFVMLDGELVWAYQRTTEDLYGDGKLRVYDLLKILEERLLTTSDMATDRKKQVDRLFASIPKKELHRVLAQGEELTVHKEVKNLALGGNLKPVTLAKDNPYIPFAKKAMETVGLRFGALDICIPDIANYTDLQYYIFEVNSTPFFGNAWKLGHQQQVKEVYKRLLWKCKQEAEK